MSFFKFKRNPGYKLFSDIIFSKKLKNTQVALVGSSPSRKSKFISNILAPLAVESGESFSILRESEGLLLAECIKELSFIGHSILSVSAETNKELSDHVIEIVGKQSSIKPTHVIIRYPDDHYLFDNRSDLQVKFITECISSFFRNKTSSFSESSDYEIPDKTEKSPKTEAHIKSIPLYMGDINRYILNDDFLNYFFMSLSQLRGLGYQSFLNISVKNKSLF